MWTHRCFISYLSIVLKKWKEKHTIEVKEFSIRRSPRFLPSHLKETSEKESTYVEKEPDISLLPPIVFKGCINYIKDFNACASICDDIIKDVENCDNEIVPIGFDLEWPFSFQTGSGKTALAQICLNKNICHLLHIYSLKKLPAAFVILLSHPKVKLVGVNIKNDVWKLGRDFKEFPAQKVVENNCLDSGTFANKVLNRSCRWSLEKLTAYLLQKRIDKNKKVRMSKWHIHPLSEEQKNYAATDAYVSWLLHTTIQEKADNKKTEEKEVDL
ncbi:3'-5' exonuclease isoform X1 [Hylaeus volcanicus]|uniref:3'-5' exonuclease isoform X1 n=1 Tax=Hylaeus volcanicus TaxID=313075 RepID=UPI0023B78BB2|nr:3'-5' exonuclease isoform X1 [Hylaeus volcanicus]